MAERKIQGRMLDRIQVKCAMLRKGEMSTGDLAKALSLSKMSVNARLNGRTQCRMLELERISEILGVPVDVLAPPTAKSSEAAPTVLA